MEAVASCPCWCAHVPAGGGLSMNADPSSSGPIGVVQVVLSLGTGGTERLVVEMCQRLQNRFRMTVCALDAPGGWAPELQLRGVDVVPLFRRPGFRPALGYQIARIAA